MLTKEKNYYLKRCETLAQKPQSSSLDEYRHSLEEASLTIERQNQVIRDQTQIIEQFEHKRQKNQNESPEKEVSIVDSGRYNKAQAKLIEELVRENKNLKDDTPRKPEHRLQNQITDLFALINDERTLAMEDQLKEVHHYIISQQLDQTKRLN